MLSEETEIREVHGITNEQRKEFLTFYKEQFIVGVKTEKMNGLPPEIY